MRFAFLLLLAIQAQGATVRINQYKFPTGSTLNTDLIAHWSMEESTGATRNDSEPTGTPQNLSDVNSVTLTGGIQGNAALFTAANNEALIRADSADLSVGNIDFALAGWFKFTSFTADQSLVSHWSAVSSERAWDMRFGSAAGKLVWHVTNDGVTDASREMTSFGTPATNVWIFWYVFHDSVNDLIGGSVNDGTVNTAAHTLGVLNSSANFVVGSLGNGIQYFDGVVDELSFWKRRLTVAEVTELYAAGASKFCCPY